MNIFETPLIIIFSRIFQISGFCELLEKSLILRYKLSLNIFLKLLQIYENLFLRNINFHYNSEGILFQKFFLKVKFNFQKLYLVRFEMETATKDFLFYQLEIIFLQILRPFKIFLRDLLTEKIENFKRLMKNITLRYLELGGLVSGGYLGIEGKKNSFFCLKF